MESQGFRVLVFQTRESHSLRSSQRVISAFSDYRGYVHQSVQLKGLLGSVKVQLEHTQLCLIFMHVPNVLLRKANITAIFHLILLVLIIYPSLELLLVQKLEILCRWRLTY